MSLFNDASGELIYAGPIWSTDEKRTAMLYEAYAQAIDDPRSSGVIDVGVASGPQPVQSGGPPSTYTTAVTGAGLRAATSRQPAPPGHLGQALPARRYFGTNGRMQAASMAARSDHVARFVDHGGAEATPVIMGATDAQAPIASKTRAEAMAGGRMPVG